MTVGAFDIVSADIEEVSGTFVDEVGEGFELLVGVDALKVVMVEKLITMSVVESAPGCDWKPADAAKLEDDGPTVGSGTELVLPSVKNGIEVDDGFARGETELLLVAGIWFVVDEPALGWAPSVDELELLGVFGLGKDEELDKGGIGELAVCEVLVLGPSEIVGWALEVGVLIPLDEVFVDDVVGCVVVDPEELVLGGFCIADPGSAAPVASETPVGVGIVDVELVDMCVDVDDVVVLMMEEVDGLGTWLEVDVVEEAKVVGTGIMVRISALGEELELVVLRVVVEEGTLRGRLSICQHFSDRDTSWILLSAISIASYQSCRAQSGK
jgi:hypothetical protein